MEVQTAHCDTSPEARETHERILDAAQKLFAEKGLDATSVRDITTAAECNVAAVNYHFGGKENLKPLPRVIQSHARSAAGPAAGSHR